MFSTGLNRCRLCTGLATFVTDYQCNSTAHDHSSTGTACVKTTPWKSSIARRPYAGDLGSGPFAGPSALSLLRESGGAASLRWDKAAAAPLFDYCQRGQSFSSWEPRFAPAGAQKAGCAVDGGTRHQVWFQDNRSIAARREAIVEQHGLRGMGVFMADYMGAQDTAAPLWRALSLRPATARTVQTRYSD